MRPPGVTSHISRIRIPNVGLQSDDDFKRLIAAAAGYALSSRGGAPLWCMIPDRVPCSAVRAPGA